VIFCTIVELENDVQHELILNMLKYSLTQQIGSRMAKRDLTNPSHSILLKTFSNTTTKTSSNAK
jgi:hypothetical protein